MLETDFLTRRLLFLLGFAAANLEFDCQAAGGESIREYAGAYRWGPDSYLYLQLWDEFSGFGQPPQLVAFDESGEVRTLYPAARDHFTAGSGIAVPSPVQSQIAFARDREGRIASLNVAAGRRGGSNRKPCG